MGQISWPGHYSFRRLRWTRRPRHNHLFVLNMTTTPPFKSAARQLESILAPLEKRTLAWFAERMPAWVNSDHLTVLGFVAMFLAGACYYMSQWHHAMLLAAIVCLAVNWFGDSLDGTLARYRKRQRPRYGFYVDHIVDAFGALFLIGGIGLSGYMTREIAMALLIAYYLLSIEIYLATYTVGVFKLSYGIFGPTELRVLLAVGNLVLFFKPYEVRVLGDYYRLYDVGAVVGMIGMSVVAVSSAIRNTARLYNEERLP
jgi:archaetidylinositol phosphate synthase